MPGTNAGTGQPIAFVCAAARRAKAFNEYSVPPGHAHVERTGRERPYAGYKGGMRMTPVQREYRCECGHTGWSALKELTRFPLAAARAGDAAGDAESR